MARFIVRSSVTLKNSTECQTWKKGEALRLSTSPVTASLVSHGFLVEEHIGVKLLDSYEARVKVLADKLGYPLADAQAEASLLVGSLLKRHESFKCSPKPSSELVAEVEDFNRTSTGNNPVTKVDAGTGVGEWAGYRCNIGKGCSHGCLYCYAEKMATRFDRVASSAEWRTEDLKEVSTAGIARYDSPIMFPTTHDITPPYLHAYRCHLFNILSAGNKVLVVSKPHLEAIQAICADALPFQDQLLFRFTIGGIDDAVMSHWEPGAPSFSERFECLKFAFENGYATSVSAEPMLGGKEEAVKLYQLLAPYITKEIWFGKMNRIGGMKANPDPAVARNARLILEQQSDDEIMEFVNQLDGLPKVAWKDSIQEVCAKRSRTLGQ